MISIFNFYLELGFRIHIVWQSYHETNRRLEYVADIGNW